MQDHGVDGPSGRQQECYWVTSGSEHGCEYPFPGKKVTHEVVADGPRKLFAQVIMGKRAQPKTGGAQIKIGETVLGEGDGAYIDGVKGPSIIEIESVGDKPAEFLLFDMGPEEQ